jgi:hypothetical protein
MLRALTQYFNRHSSHAPARFGGLYSATVLLGFAFLFSLQLTAQSTAQQSPPNGSHDFDFNFGVWHTSITRTADPFQDGAPTMKLEGTVTVRKVWGGRAALEEIEAEGPKGHWEGLSLFLYNPQAHQWSQTFMNSRLATLEPPLIGSFKDGRGELIAQDTFTGRGILVRATWFDISKDAHRYREEYSDDGGQTWHAAFNALLTRDTAAESASPEEAVAPADEANTNHLFDFDFGSWHTHTSRLLQPFANSTTWTPLYGTTVVHKIWGGRANLAEYKASGPSGTVELLSLRWYNTTTHQWSVDFATPQVGILGTPAVGEFRNGRLDVYDQEEFQGRSILIRFSIWSIGSDKSHSEQAFSADGGRTWEASWTNDYAR